MICNKAILSLVLLVVATLSGAAFAQPVAAATITSESASIGALAISRQTMSPLSAGASTQALPRVFSPTLPRTVYTKYPWKTDIVATVFWVGELPSGANTTPNHASSWDASWMTNFGGFDDPNKRAGDYRPAAFVPRQNPFYVALPYNDCVNSSITKKDAGKVIPWFKQFYKEPGKSVCRDRWLAIRCGERICYAQWSDCGPFVTDDSAYVFGDARPANSKNGGAGIDISPSVRDCLEFKSGQKCDWRFVDTHEVPDGPWKSWGGNNQFVQQVGRDKEFSKDVASSRLEELRRQRDEWFKKNGNADYARR